MKRKRVAGVRGAARVGLRSGLLGYLALLAGCGGGGFAGGRAAPPPSPAPPSSPAPAGEVDPGGVVPISVVQGAGHASPLLGARVGRVEGVVTVVVGDGFFLESRPEDRDSDSATSEGLFVYTGGPPDVLAGDLVAVLDAEVDEFGFAGELTSTELVGGAVERIGAAELPPPVLVGGSEGRRPPGEIVDDDGFGAFEPVTDGLDFWESLESMRIVLFAPEVVGARSPFGEIPVVAGDGAAGPRTSRGGLRNGPGDDGPERLFLDDVLVKPSPAVLAGDHFAGDATGLLTYSFGNYKLWFTEPLPPVLPAAPAPTVARLVRDEEHLTVATMNVFNLAPLEFQPGRRGPALARAIVEELRSPDVLVLEEVQDSSGGRNDGRTDAHLTLLYLRNAVIDAGGPPYEWVEIAPLDNAEGGAPGANIRVAMLYDPLRLTLANRPPPPPSPLAPVRVTGWGPEAGLSWNPGRVDPGNPAFSDPEPSRRPLAAEFLFRGERFFVIGAHLKSRRQDDLLFGGIQPPRRPTEAQRVEQARAVNAFVQELLGADPDARIVVAGDLNDFEHGPAVRALAGAQLANLVRRIPVADRYSYVFDGHSQCLDHLLASPALFGGEAEIVHLAADAASNDRPTDHDPVLARFPFPAPAAGPADLSIGVIDATGRPRGEVTRLVRGADLDLVFVVGTGELDLPEHPHRRPVSPGGRLYAKRPISSAWNHVDEGAAVRLTASGGRRVRVFAVLGETVDPSDLPPGEPFVLLLASLADPVDGKEAGAAVARLLERGRFAAGPPPAGKAGLAAATASAAEALHLGDPSLDTFLGDPEKNGGLRREFVLPSPEIRIRSARVLRPDEAPAGGGLVVLELDLE